ALKRVACGAAASSRVIEKNRPSRRCVPTHGGLARSGIGAVRIWLGFRHLHFRRWWRRLSGRPTASRPAPAFLGERETTNAANCAIASGCSLFFQGPIAVPGTPLEIICVA